MLEYQSTYPYRFFHLLQSHAYRNKCNFLLCSYNLHLCDNYHYLHIPKCLEAIPIELDGSYFDPWHNFKPSQDSPSPVKPVSQMHS